MSDIQTNVIKPSVIFTENDIDYKNIGEGFESNLDNKYQAILDFIKNNNGKGKTELEKDSLYKSAHFKGRSSKQSSGHDSELS